MLSRARTAVKFFTYGLAIGVMFAPGAGADTRRRLRAAVTRQQGQGEDYS